MVIETYPPQTDIEEADIGAVESAVVTLQKAIAKENVSEKTKASANRAIEEANQAIDAANRTIKLVQQAFVRFHYIEDLETLITNLETKTEKVREAYLANATSTSYIEGIIQEARASIHALRSRVTEISENISQGGFINEDIKASVNQIIEKANQAITRADQAIKDLLTLS